MPSDPGQSSDRAYHHRRRPANEPPPAPDPASSPDAETQVPEDQPQYICRRFECISRGPFTSNPNAQGEPVCPYCNKSDKVEEIVQDDGGQNRRYGALIAVGAGLLIAVLSLGWWLSRTPAVSTVANQTTADGPKIAALPDRIDFGDTPVDTEGRRSFEIKNIGGAPLTISGAAATPQDNFRVELASLEVPGGASATVVFIFSPKLGGQISGTVTIHTNADGGAGAQIAVQGNGIGRTELPRDSFWLFDELDKTSKILTPQ